MLGRINAANLAIALVILAACSSDRDPASLLREAKQFQSKGEHAAAIIQFRNLLSIEPDNIEARRLLAESYNADNQPAAAEDEIRKAIQDGADPRALRSTLARALLFQGKGQRVLDEIVPDPQASPSDALTISAARGLAYLRLGNIKEAKLLLERVTAAEPHHVDSLLGLAGIAMAENRPDDALKFVERAIESDAGNIDAWLLKGEMLKVTMKAAPAAAAYEQALKLQPNNIAAHMQLASLKIDIQKFDEAAKHLEEVRSKIKDNTLANYLYALIEFRKNNLPVAAKAIEDLLQSTPNHAPGLYLAGAIEYSKGNFDAATKHLQKLLDRSPDNSAARRMLTMSLVKGGQIQRAIDMIEQALASSPEDSELIALLGEANLQKGDIPRALSYLEKASRLQPKDARTTNSLQIARLIGGQTNRALADLEATIKVDAGGANGSAFLYVAALMQRRDFDAALKILPQIEKRYPNDPITHNLRAAALLGKGDPDGARRSLENALAINPRFLPAIVNLSNLDLRERNPRQVRRRIEGLLERDPANPAALTALEQFSARIGVASDEMLEFLERARRAHPQSPGILAQVARVHMQSGNAQKALELAEAAQRYSPDVVEVLEVIGAAQTALGRLGDALGTYSKMALQNPNSPDLLLKFARSQAANANTAGATLTLKKALAIDPNYGPALGLLGEMELAGGRWAAAAQIARDLQQRFPRAPAGYAMEGDALSGQKQHAAAVKAYEAAVQSGDRSARTTIKISMSLVALGRQTDADSLLARFVKDNPRETLVLAYIADSHLSAGRFAIAADHYQKVLAVQPNNALVLNNLAWATFKLNDPKARELAEKAYALAPENPVVLDTYGWILSEAGESARGAELLQRAATASPNSRPIRFHLARSLMKAGQYARARKELETALSGTGPFEEEKLARELLEKMR